MKSDDDKKDYENKFFFIYIYTISNFFSFFLLCITKIRSKRKNKKTEVNKDINLKKSKTSKSSLNLDLIYNKDLPISFSKLLIRTIIVAFTDLLAQYSIFIFYIFINVENVELDLIIIFNILFKYIFSKLILKTNYYRHHYLSFVINIICLVLICTVDIYNIFDNWNENTIYFILIKIFSSICYAFEDVIGKKALIKEFLSPFSILLYKGIYELFLLVLLSIPFFFIKVEDENIFYVFSKRLNNFKKIFFAFLLMIMNFAYNVFIWIINDRFSPNDLGMAMAIQGIIDKIDFLIFNFNELNDTLILSIYKILIYLILVFGTCIHNEILIINYCDLNEYTKKKINIKSKEDFESANERTLTQTTFNSINSQDINDRASNRETILTELSERSNENL